MGGPGAIPHHRERGSGSLERRLRVTPGDRRWGPHQALLILIPNSGQEEPRGPTAPEAAPQDGKAVGSPPYGQRGGTGRLARPELRCPGLLNLETGGCWGLRVTQQGAPELVWPPWSS